MDRSSRVLFLAVLNFLGFLGTVIVNGLANALPINGKTTSELSDQYPNLFVPAGLTFTIWGVIYLLLAIFVLYQLFPSTRKNPQYSSFIEKIGLLFFISSLANISWILAWHYEFVPLSLFLMLILFGSLLAVYLRLGIGKAEATKAEKYLVHLPFSVYLGWITVATIANATALLVDINWGRFGLSEQFWAVAVIIIGIILALSVIFTRKDVYYGLVIDWAFFGILLKRLSTPSMPDQSVEIISIVGLVLVTAGIVFLLIRRKVY